MQRVGGGGDESVGDTVVKHDISWEQCVRSMTMNTAWFATLVSGLFLVPYVEEQASGRRWHCV